MNEMTAKTDFLEDMTTASIARNASERRMPHSRSFETGPIDVNAIMMSKIDNRSHQLAHHPRLRQLRLRDLRHQHRQCLWQLR